MKDESVNMDAVHAAVVHNEETRKEYRREWMKKKRAEEKLKKELESDQSGEVSLASVEKESVVETALGGSDVVTSEPDAYMIRGEIHTPTDAEFERKSPGYWIYGNEVKERKCWQCGKGYKTRLELNKFCGPKCKEKWLSDAFGKLKGNGKKEPVSEATVEGLR